MVIDQSRRDLQHLDRVLHDREAVEIGMHHDIRNVAVHEQFTRREANDLVGWHTAVGTADPEESR